MPVTKASNGKYRIGKGRAMYTSRAAAAREHVHHEAARDDRRQQDEGREQETPPEGDARPRQRLPPLLERAPGRVRRADAARAD